MRDFIYLLFSSNKAIEKPATLFFDDGESFDDAENHSSPPQNQKRELIFNNLGGEWRSRSAAECAIQKKRADVFVGGRASDEDLHSAHWRSEQTDK
jgi:hypothetical protein